MQYALIVLVAGIIELGIILGLGRFFGSGVLYTSAIIGLIIYIGVLWWALSMGEISRPEKEEKKPTSVKQAKKPSLFKQIIRKPKKIIQKPKKPVKPLFHIDRPKKPTKPLVPRKKGKVLSKESYEGLKEYIKNSLFHGYKKENIRVILLKTGWLAKDVDKAFKEIGPMYPSGLIISHKPEKKTTKKRKNAKKKTK